MKEEYDTDYTNKLRTVATSCSFFFLNEMSLSCQQ